MLAVLVLALATASAFVDSNALATMSEWLLSKMKSTDAAKPVPPVQKPAPLVPLSEQIPRCLKVASGFQACMFDAGYAVNPDWVAAHNKDSAVVSTSDVSNAIEVIADQRRSGASPAYRVPFWVPRASLQPPP